MSRGARKEGLSRRHRYSGRGAFSAALRNPRKLRGATTLLHVAPGRPGLSRIGVAVAKRLAPAAIDRNRLKRLVREAFRKHSAKFAGLDIVIAPRERYSRATERAWLAEITELLDRSTEMC
jgi:ribonuclease P protein component